LRVVSLLGKSSYSQEIDKPFSAKIIIYQSIGPAGSAASKPKVSSFVPGCANATKGKPIRKQLCNILIN
jgi:hypothetical protein